MYAIAVQEIRARSGRASGSASSHEQEHEEQEQQKAIRFRNYQPRDAALAKTASERVSEAVSNGGSGSGSGSGSGEEQVIADSDIIKNALRECTSEGVSEELNLLPRSNNWDLKQQLEPKLEKLKRRTQRAIVELLREKLAAEEGSDSDSGEEE
jgi:coiled-coil domain-containing protein 12